MRITTHFVFSEKRITSYPFILLHLFYKLT